MQERITIEIIGTIAIVSMIVVGVITFKNNRK